MGVTSEVPHYTLEIRGPMVPTRLDHDAVEQARLVRNARATLLAEAGVITTDMIADGRGCSAQTARQWLLRRRKAGLITIEENGHVLVPSYQLDEAFELSPAAAEVNVALSGLGMDPWATWFWMYAPNGWLGTRPVDALTEGDLDGVLAAVAGLVPDE
jgi:hypothetical protein